MRNANQTHPGAILREDYCLNWHVSQRLRPQPRRLAQTLHAVLAEAQRHLRRKWHFDWAHCWAMARTIVVDMQTKYDLWMARTKAARCAAEYSAPHRLITQPV